ncbi:hypothetical protein Q5424_13820 [Conexibacter sp. JD483]|uniref:hypothetical protein n=1 Tax=unclassified Conexibacter TaxID=2627773 RepID=UPI002726B41E|nr:MULTISPECIES: hypothetical protein [unclassified Conexibacter]MDO8188247.1 hypothetical protein [Conexibacter sp. CPCC 205706]MDO8197398.1 hypothetical protein [Conexibacter sp. CPCC 205762]MDR9370174.1 hypothetical protein [Conexibacter sp. JD483]
MTRPFRPVPPLLALLCATVALAACGSGSGSGDGGKSDEEQRLAYVDCLRDEGIDVVSSGRGIGIRMGQVGRAESGPRMDDSRRAFDTCRKKTGWAPPEPTEAQQQEMQQRGLAFARCMREHGADVPDPAADGRMTLRVDRGNSAVFERAQRACGRVFGGGSFAPAATATPAG